jgi:hypothetical protein
MFSSCTCHQQVSQQPEAERPAFREPPSGFHAAGATATPQAQAQAPTATPVALGAKTPPEQVAAGATPTAPAQMPQNFPKDVPIFKDAALSQVQDLANQAHNVIFTTAAPVTDVSSFYEDKLTRAGWRITQQFTRSNHAFMTFQKGSMIANVTVAEDVRNPGQQVIAIMYEEQQGAEFDDF